MAHDTEVREGEMEEGTFELKCGVTLHLRQINRQALRPIMLKLGGASALQNPEDLRDLTGKRAEQAVLGIEQLFNYCAGWGVTDDAPQEAIEELAEMRFRVDTARLARISWIRYSLLEDEDEAGELVGAILAFSSKGWMVQGEGIEESKAEAKTKAEA